MIESRIQVVPFVIDHTQEPVGPMLAQGQIGLLGEPEQMSCCLFYLLKFARGQIDDRLGEEETSGVMKARRLFSQGFVQVNERHVFMPAGLVGECQEKAGVAGYKLLAWRSPFQRRAGALQARLCLPGKE